MKHAVGQLDWLGFGDFNVVEAGLDQAQVMLPRQGTRDATDVESHRMADRLGKVSGRNDIRDAEMRGGPQDPEDLGKCARLVRNEVEHAVADDDIDGSGFDGQVLYFAQTELHVAVTELRRVLPGERDHLGRHVHADDPTPLAHDPSRDERVDPRAGAEVEDRVALLDPGMLCRQTTAETEIGLWQVAVDGLIRVAYHVQPEVRSADVVAGVAADPGPAAAALCQGGRGVALPDDLLDLDIGGHLFVSLHILHRRYRASPPGLPK